MAWPVVAAAAVGAIAGGQKKKSGGWNSSSNSSSVELRNFEDLNKGRSGLEAAAYDAQLNNLNQLQDLTNRGPGTADVMDSQNYQRDFASRLQGLMDRGVGPNAQEIAQAQGFAQSMFAPAQEGLRQQFTQMNVENQRLAARLGRVGTDPVLRNKLMQEQGNQQTMLNLQQGAFATQYAQQLPMMQQQNVMNLGSAIGNIKAGLATQAFQNRQALVSMGNQLTNAERNYRLQTAGRTSNSYSTGEQWQGGGTAGALTGAMGGIGTGMSMAGMSSMPSLSSMFGGLFSGAAKTAAATPMSGMNMTPGSMIG